MAESLTEFVAALFDVERLPHQWAELETRWSDAAEGIRVKIAQKQLARPGVCQADAFMTAGADHYADTRLDLFDFADRRERIGATRGPAHD